MRRLTWRLTGLLVERLVVYLRDNVGRVDLVGLDGAAQQVRTAMNAHDLHIHRVLGLLQKLRAAHRLLFLGDQAARPSGLDERITLDRLIGVIQHVVVIQARDGSLDRAVDIVDHFLDTAAGAAHQHRQARCRALRAALRGLAGVGIRRDTALVICHLREVVIDRHQLLRIAAGLKEVDGILPGVATVRVRHRVEDPPRADVLGVLTGREPVFLYLGHWARGERHVIRKRAAGAIGQILCVRDDLRNALIPELAGQLFETRLEVVAAS